MAEEGFVSISVEVWERKLAAYIAATGKGIREALYEEWPFLIRKIMDFTPPFKAKGGRGVSDLSVGRAAVANDIYKTMRPFDPAQIKTKAMRRIVETKDIAAFNIVAARSKSALLSGVQAIPFSPQVHLSQRDARGRVRGRDRRRVVLGTDAVLLKRYVTKVQSMVGYAKSGWLKALHLVGGTGPAYVEKHGTGGGEVIDDHANDENPSITAINHTPWAVRKDEGERIKSDAYYSRIESIHRKTQLKLKEAAKQAGLAA